MPEELASMKAQVYKDPRPKEYFDRFHERSRTREPDWVYEVVRTLTSLYAWTFFRARGIAAENVPNGPVIIAPNHFSFMDHFFVGAFIRRRVRGGCPSPAHDAAGDPPAWLVRRRTF